jgi:glycerol uptake facilitator protein
LPIPGKGDSNFGYSWIPVIGPLTGGVLGVTVYEFLFENIENIYLYLSVGIFLLVSTLSIIESKN